MAWRVVVATVAVVLAIGSANAKTKGALTEQDVLACIGSNGSTAKEQVAACTKVIESGKIKPPHEGDYYATRAAAYSTLGQNDEALADLRKALTYRQVPEIYFQRALLYMSMKKGTEADADLVQVAKLKPDFPASYFMRGLIAFDGGRFDDAVGLFDEAVKRQPTYYQAIYARGVAKKKAGDDKGGDADVKQAKGMSKHVEGDMEKLGLKL